MSDETHKFSKEREFREEMPFRRQIKHYFNRIQQIFAHAEKPAQDLHGRIHEVAEDCQKLAEELIALKEKAVARLGPAASSHFNGVIEGFVKELSRIQRETERTHDLTHRVKLTNRYKEWTDEVRAWLSLESVFNQPRKINQSILLYNVQEYDKKIDKDLQVVEDYVRHALLECGEDEEGRARLRMQVMQQVEPLLEKLHQLKNFKTPTTLEELAGWRVSADHARGKCFSDALHAVDSVFNRTEFLDPPDHY